AQRLAKGGHEVVAFDAQDKARQAFAGKSVDSLQALVAALPAPRVAWMMVPSGDPTEATKSQLASLLSPGDILVDGGNSNYKDTQRRAKEVAERGIHYVDCGTSGGVWGLENGYALMVGGDEAAVAKLRPIFETL